MRTFKDWVFCLMHNAMHTFKHISTDSLRSQVLVPLSVLPPLSVSLQKIRQKMSRWLRRKRCLTHPLLSSEGCFLTSTFILCYACLYIHIMHEHSHNSHTHSCTHICTHQFTTTAAATSTIITTIYHHHHHHHLHHNIIGWYDGSVTRGAYTQPDVVVWNKNCPQRLICLNT